MLKTLPSAIKAASKLFRPFGGAKAFASESDNQNPANQLDSASLKRFKTAAESGDSEAMFRLGRAFEKGFGTDVDLLEAFKWYQEAAKNNHPEAQIASATLQEKREFINASFIEKDEVFFQEDLAALKNLPPTLRCEDSNIPLYLGYARRFYPVKGEPGKEIIDSEAFLQDIKDHHPKRMFQLAVLYQYRRLTPPSEHAIGKWTVRAGYAGYIPAATSAGKLFFPNGVLQPKNYRTVVHFFWMAAQANEPVALREIWNLQFAARPFLPFNDLFKCLILAAEAGEPEAEVLLYQNLIRSPIARGLYPCDPDKFLDSAAKKGYPKAVKLRKKTRRF